ncbi:hypothetical protein KUCAC02_030960 [Chaenocephalus aceratus]|uniref:Uncharacterized protein n=1 Tax=Chaenocephalus aceratus TaxID=36190 RepID=A0ACB9XKG9_CHAAC|nr:hypothetical protein KUCAC02_030960 [Chaenocephalus aceratus]
MTLLQLPLDLAAAVSQPSLTHQTCNLKVTCKFRCQDARELHPVSNVQLRDEAVAPADDLPLAPWAGQIAAEFTRLVAADLPKSFLLVDRHLPRLLELYKARERRDTKIHSLLESLDSENSTRTEGLQHFLDCHIS